ncbi:MAG: beta-ketoacyl synthase N-terminal-like domain-containing protein [Desulfobacterales bacterium]
MKIRIFITGIGIITPAGSGCEETRNFIKNDNRAIRPLGLFQTSQSPPLPVGEITTSLPNDMVPRTHILASIAADQALAEFRKRVDAIVIGTTTGGMTPTEELLKKNETNPDAYQYHAAGSVADYIARRIRCSGPVITVSTACSSGTSAIKIALEMLRTGTAKSVLAGGADSLCRFTYFGFHSLQLIDPTGPHPFDQCRRGMVVSEGAAALLLEAGDTVPENALAEILGAGLSCDAYHPTAPHPEGAGALKAMTKALEDAAVSKHNIDYVNLHGTGTIDNDLSESRAIHALFGDKKPLISSVKGAIGHPLAAAGAIEAAISAICISENIVPANSGCENPDPALNLCPVKKPLNHPIQTVLSNSFGFGGNNASVVIGSLEGNGNPVSIRELQPLEVIGSECLTGAGGTAITMDRFSKGESCKGLLPIAAISRNLSPRAVRRLKRLPQIALSLADAVQQHSEAAGLPSSVFWSTGWGALSESYDFLEKLFESDEKFSSPTDFIGSVHNAAAGQIAIQYKATGPNITTTGGDYSFEQALLTATLLTDRPEESMFVIGADEYHTPLSRLFDRSTLKDRIASDGGGALLLRQAEHPGGLRIFPVFFENSENNPDIIPSLIQRLGNSETINTKFGSLFAGIPAACRKSGEKQVQEFISRTGFQNPVIDYRKYLGEFASASAAATVLAIHFIREGRIPGPLSGKGDVTLQGKSILMLGTGPFVTAIEVFRS